MSDLAPMSDRDKAYFALVAAFDAWCVAQPYVTVRIDLEAGSTRHTMEREYRPATPDASEPRS